MPIINTACSFRNLQYCNEIIYFHMYPAHAIYTCTLFCLFGTFYSFFYNVFTSQLFYDGHQQLAVQLSNLVKAHPACPPSDRLFKVVKFGLESEEGEF